MPHNKTDHRDGHLERMLNVGPSAWQRPNSRGWNWDHAHLLRQVHYDVGNKIGLESINLAEYGLPIGAVVNEHGEYLPNNTLLVD